MIREKRIPGSNSWGRVGAVALLGAVVALTLLPAPAESQENADANLIQVWNVSLHLVDKTDAQVAATNASWRSAFKEIAATTTYTPDLISVLEAPFRDKGTVLQEIEKRLDADYDTVHSDKTSSACRTTRSDNCGNTLMVYRTARFQQVCPGGMCEVLRWPRIENGDKNCGTAEPNPGQLAAQFLDKDQEKKLVFVSLHLPAQAPPKCMAPNVKRMNDLVEKKWKTRLLTIVAGDFNEPPDDHGALGRDAATHDQSYEEWRKETDPSCWYRKMSQSHTGDDCTTLAGSDWTFPYYDTVWEKQAGTNPSDEICRKWTLGNAGVPAANDEWDRCDSRKNRVDYIWVRYETPDGMAVRKDAGDVYPDQQIHSADVDKGYFDPTPDQFGSGDEVRYSDHRALWAVVYWCSPAVAAADTPCATG